MESNAFGSSHLPSQALVVLSEAASGLHEALRGQRPFPTRLPDAKDLHNMSLVGSYGTHLLHSFHPHLLQSLNHGMLANGGPASYFASDRGGLGKPSVLSNFQLPSAFSPPKYIGISLDQNLFNGSESFRTDSASPTCTSHESMEGSNDYDPDKGESPRSNNSDPRDLRHVHSKPAATSSATTTATTTTGHHLHHQHHQQQQQQQQPPLHQHPHLHPHHPLPNGTLVSSGSLTTGVAAGGPVMSIVGCPGMRAGIGAIGGLSVGAGPGTGAGAGHVPDGCPVCGLKLTAEEWNSHFLTELDRLYKLSAGMERPSLQASYMFAPPCPAQENAIRTSHNRWETFQRIRNNRQNRLRVKVRKRKFGSEMYFLDNLFCSSCPICKRKYALETTGKPPEDDPKALEEIETVDVESCNDDVPDSGSELHNQNSTSGSASGSSSVGSVSGSNMHSSNNQPGKLDGILYRTACVINKEGGEEDLVSTNSGIGGAGPAPWESHLHPATTTTTSAHPPGPTTTQGHITVKAVSELSSTTHHFYNADSCGEERLGGKDAAGDVDREGDGDADADVSMCNNDSDEDVIVDDDDSIKMSLGRKRKYEETVVSSRSSDNLSPPEERPRSEPQVTSTEPGMEMPHNNNNSIANNNKYHVFEELRTKQHLELQQHHHQQQQQQQQQHLQQTLRQEADNGPGLTQLDSKVGICSENKPDEEYKCFICKTGIKDFSSDFFRGRNLYFHQSCANVMSSYRLSKDLQQQQQSLIQQQQQQQQQESRKSPPSSGAN